MKNVINNERKTFILPFKSNDHGDNDIISSVNDTLIINTDASTAALDNNIDDSTNVLTVSVNDESSKIQNILNSVINPRTRIGISLTATAIGASMEQQPNEDDDDDEHQSNDNNNKNENEKDKKKSLNVIIRNYLENRHPYILLS